MEIHEALLLMQITPINMFVFTLLQTAILKQSLFLQ